MRRMRFLLTGLMILILSGCANYEIPAPECPNGASGVSYSGDIQPIFSPELLEYSLVTDDTQSEISIRATADSREYWLRTSPEYHMKRLLLQLSACFFSVSALFK